MNYNELTQNKFAFHNRKPELAISKKSQKPMNERKQHKVDSTILKQIWIPKGLIDLLKSQDGPKQVWVPKSIA